MLTEQSSSCKLFFKGISMDHQTISLPAMPFAQASREGGFVLVAKLASPAIIQGSFTLEGLLAAAVFERTGKMRDDALARVPLTSKQPNDEAGARLWLASAVHYLGHVAIAEETILRRRRRDETGPDFYLGNPRARKTCPFAIEQSRDDYKALLNSYSSTYCEALVWFGHGDAQQCADLIESLAFIGKRRGQGFGQISEVSVRQFAADPVIRPDGMVRRPIPASWLAMLEGAAPIERQRQAFVSAHHPVWAHPAELCAVPGSCEITEADITMASAPEDEPFFG